MALHKKGPSLKWQQEWQAAKKTGPVAAPRAINSAPEPRLHGPAGARALGVQVAPGKGSYLQFALIQSEVTDLGRSRGMPRARSQKTWLKAPMARDTPKSTVKYSYCVKL